MENGVSKPGKPGKLKNWTRHTEMLNAERRALTEFEAWLKANGKRWALQSFVEYCRSGECPALAECCRLDGGEVEDIIDNSSIWFTPWDAARKTPPETDNQEQYQSKLFEE